MTDEARLSSEPKVAPVFMGSPRKSAPQVETSSDGVSWKLSPELRVRAKKPTGKPALVTVLLSDSSADLSTWMENVVYSKPLGGLRWATGEVREANLAKLAGLDKVVFILSSQTYKPLPPVDELLPFSRDRLSEEELRILLQKGDKEALYQKLLQWRRSQQQRKPSLSRSNVIAQTGLGINSVKVKDIHGTTAAHSKGYTGTGVIVSIVDTGVDFAHPDLQGTQARIPSGPYAGWPFAYDTLSGLYYALYGLAADPYNYTSFLGGDRTTRYARTLPVSALNCNGLTCSATLTFQTDAGEEQLNVTFPNTSKSGQYLYTVYPPDKTLYLVSLSRGLGYPLSDYLPPVVIVADENSAGVYDTVYVDVNSDADLTNDKPLRKGDEIGGADLLDASGSQGQDGIWDISVGMLTWIADGQNHPPGVSALYEFSRTVPGPGRLIAFVGDSDISGHGTSCASLVAARGVISDPEWIGIINPLFAGGENIGGAGGAVLAGMAPGVTIAAFENSYSLPLEAWFLSAIGFDGRPSSGDEAQIVSNSWGASRVIEDGWFGISRFAHWLNRRYAPNTVFLVATGNGGHGYGTVTDPNGGTIIDVGASTSYGSSTIFELVEPEQFTYGDIQPWSNRGPGALGDIAPDIVAVGAWGTAALPLNSALLMEKGNGQVAYDLFGGTSMATPVAAGNLALVYQAFKARHNRWPTWSEATSILLSSANDLGYDVLTQGAGNVNADRATDIASGAASDSSYWLEPAQWVAGSYRGTNYLAFPNILHPGDTVSRVFTIHNTGSSSYTLSLEGVTLRKVHEITFSVSFPRGATSPFTRPTWLTDITQLITTYQPDLVKAEVILPYSAFDPDHAYFSESRLFSYFYDWTDLNNDGNLWTDTNGNGWIDSWDEIDWITHSLGITIHEYNRLTFGYPVGTYIEARAGRDSLSRIHDGIFFGLQRIEGANDRPVTLDVRITLYREQSWDWLKLSSREVSVPSNGNASFIVEASVPITAQLGVYEGAIKVGSGRSSSVIPVLIHVAANSATFSFGAPSLNPLPDDLLYSNARLQGGFNWIWRYESGDWKLFYFDIPTGSTLPGESMIVQTEWSNPVTMPNSERQQPYFYESFSSTNVPAGWSTSGGFWRFDNPCGAANVTGGDGNFATVDPSCSGSIGNIDAELRTPTLNLSGLTPTIFLEFKYAWSGRPGVDGFVDVSSDNGTTWQNVWRGSSPFNGEQRRAVVDISDLAAGKSSVMIRFRYSGYFQWWQLDDVAIYTNALPYLPDYTDVDSWLYVADHNNRYSLEDPDFFGPQGVEQVGGSRDSFVREGIFRFDTVTGGPREIVGGDLRDGLGFVALHNVLYAGKQFGEPIVGQAYKVRVSPKPLIFVHTNSVTLSQVLTFTTSYTIDEGLGGFVFGLSQPNTWRSQPLTADRQTLCDWVYTFTISATGLIEAKVWSTDVLDIDLFLYKEGKQIAQSATPEAEEKIRVKTPEDGTYRLCVDNWSGEQGSFNLDLLTIRRRQLSIRGLPTSTLNANQTYTFTLSLDEEPESGNDWRGVLYLGPASAPSLLEVPIHYYTNLSHTLFIPLVSHRNLPPILAQEP